MWLKSALLLCCVVASVLGEDDVVTKARPGQEFVQIQGSIGESAPIQGRAVTVEDFVTSHKIPEGVAKPPEDDDEDKVEEVVKDTIEQVDKLEKKPERKLEDMKVVQQSLDPLSQDTSADKITTKRQARVQLENFSETGVLQEDGRKKVDAPRPPVKGQKDAVIPGVQVSAENPTTMVPMLTTTREPRSFDFVPVNIIREDDKDANSHLSERHFGDFSDVSLVPAGSNSRIQVKKGPNGKDYEYEYVYYYYDEEEDGKEGSTTNAHDGPSRTTSSPRRGATSNRSKYNSADRSTTVEPASNEVIPTRNGNRGRQLDSDDISEERLPANTRFPPRSRSNHNTGTTEPSRARGNRPRPSLDLVDSSSFRTHQEGPEFPQSLPKGPVRFLGVTPNEDNEEKPVTRGRGRPNRIQEPAPVEEAIEEPAPPQRRRPVAVEPEVEVETSKDRATLLESSDIDNAKETNDPASPDSTRGTILIAEDSLPVEDTKHSSLEDKQDFDLTDITTTEVPTTENPSAMDKVALDLYAFLQQGQNNLVDASSSDVDSDGTTISDSDMITEIPTTTEIIITTTTELTTTTTTTEPTTTTTTTTTEPSTTTTQAPAGRGKFRRPGVGGGVGSRNRFKTNGGSTTSTEAPAESTQRTRGRFGNNGGGFKRPRPGQKHAVEEDVQKDSSGTVNAEKPAATSSRGRFRGSGSRNALSTTSAPSTASSSSSSSSGSSSGISRPSFNKLNLNRRRGRPTTAAPSTSEENQETSETGQTDAHEASTTAKPNVRARLPGTGPRPVRPGNRINLRLRPGQTTTTTAAPEIPEVSAEEPAGEGTEEETHEAPAESSPPARLTTANPLNKLRTRNRLQVQPKASTRTPVSLAPRRSPLLPRRKTTEAPVVETSNEETSAEVSEEVDVTEATLPETSTAASTKHEEIRGLSGLLAPRRRIAPRRPGQIISRD